MRGEFKYWDCHTAGSAGRVSKLREAIKDMQTAMSMNAWSRHWALVRVITLAHTRTEADAVLMPTPVLCSNVRTTSHVHIAFIDVGFRCFRCCRCGRQLREGTKGLPLSRRNRLLKRAQDRRKRQRQRQRRNKAKAKTSPGAKEAGVSETPTAHKHNGERSDGKVEAKGAEGEQGHSSLAHDSKVTSRPRSRARQRHRR